MLFKTSCRRQQIGVLLGFGRESILWFVKHWVRFFFYLACPNQTATNCPLHHVRLKINSVEHIIQLKKKVVVVVFLRCAVGLKNWFLYSSLALFPFLLLFREFNMKSFYLQTVTKSKNIFQGAKKYFIFCTR